jgi:hypothetical protein
MMQSRHVWKPTGARWVPTTRLRPRLTESCPRSLGQRSLISTDHFTTSRLSTIRSAYTIRMHVLQGTKSQPSTPPTPVPCCSLCAPPTFPLRSIFLPDRLVASFEFGPAIRTVGCWSSLSHPIYSTSPEPNKSPSRLTRREATETLRHERERQRPWPSIAIGSYPCILVVPILASP